ncbi:Uncharacterised protein [Raoultella planticola]|uniref:Uncharacterized protein n=1 Tax=Raoultella planticola TaxID=575 RepID=A0A485BNY5_RAOPL|nr:Uncharacterised protein [Raoultella planticola]
MINRDVSLARERCVFFEQEDAAFQAVNYLITQGHRDIACMTVPMHTPTGKSPSAGIPQGPEKAWYRLGCGESEIRRFDDDPRL